MTVIELWSPLRLAGVPVRLDVRGVLTLNATNCAVVLALCAVARPEWSIPTWIAVAAAVALLLQLSAVVHEVAHLVAALGTGQRVRELVLNAFGGYVFVEADEDATDPAHLRATALYVGAGPLASLALWALFGGLAELARGHDLPAAALALALSAALNAVLLALNLLPLGPLDGARLLRVGARALGRRGATLSQG